MIEIVKAARGKMAVKVPFAFKDTFKARVNNPKWNPTDKLWVLTDDQREIVEQLAIELKEQCELLEQQQAELDLLRKQEAMQREMLRIQADKERARAKIAHDKAMLEAKIAHEKKPEVIRFKELVDVMQIQSYGREMQSLLRVNRAHAKQKFWKIQSKLEALAADLAKENLVSRGICDLCYMNYNRPDKCDFSAASESEILNITVVE